MIKNFVKQDLTCKNNEEMQYLDLVKDIIEQGSLEIGRNGNTISIFGAAMRFSLDNNVIPLLTTKRLAWKTCLKELLWFIRGSTDNAILRDQGVHIWDGNSSRNFLDSAGLEHLEENDLGPIYGHQWRHFNAPYTNCHADYSGQGVDQLQYIIDCLSDPQRRYSRRLVMSAWNPCQLNEMALPPCHVTVQFNVSKGNKSSCALYQRSGDMGLGVPFNIASYSFLTHILAIHCGLEAHEFIYTLGNCHIYENHIEAMKEQLCREPFAFPTVEIAHNRQTIEDYTLDSIAIKNYEYHNSIFMEMNK